MLVMDKDKFINTELIPTNKGDYASITTNKSNYHTIYIFKFNKDMELIKYKADVILGKTKDGKIFVVHGRQHSKNLKEGFSYYERCKCNKALDATEKDLIKHPYEYTTKIDCYTIPDNKVCYNYAIPMFEGEIYSDTIWYLDKDPSLKYFVNEILKRKEKVIQDLQKRLRYVVEMYNKLSLFYDTIGGENDETTD